MPPEKVVVGIPSNFVRQRPDIRDAERRLAARTARIGVATADLYPQFSLFGSFGWSAEDVGDLLGSSARVWRVGPSFRWNLFDGGRVRGNIQVQDARTEQLLKMYENTVLLGLEEVENAPVGYVKEQQRRDTLVRAAEVAHELFGAQDSRLARLGFETRAAPIEARVPGGVRLHISRSEESTLPPGRLPCREPGIGPQPLEQTRAVDLVGAHRHDDDRAVRMQPFVGDRRE